MHYCTYLLCFQKSYKTVLPISAVSKAKNKIKKNSAHLRFKHNDQLLSWYCKWKMMRINIRCEESTSVNLSIKMMKSRKNHNLPIRIQMHSYGFSSSFFFFCKFYASISTLHRERIPTIQCESTLNEANQCSSFHITCENGPY